MILLGTAGVGKTAFFLRVRDGVFKQSDTTCFPPDYLVKTIRIPSSDSPTEASMKVNTQRAHPLFVCTLPLIVLHP